MNTKNFTLFALLMTAGARPSAAADEPRALIERAIKAMGGAKVVEQNLAVRRKVQGVLHLHFGGGGQAVKLRGESAQLGSRSRLALESDVGGTKMALVVVIDGAKSWRDFGGEFHEFSRDEIKDLHVSRHQDRVTGLTALLADKGFAFAALPEVKVEDRPTSGLKVSYNGEPDISLYFDKETGLLVKYAYRAKKMGDEKEVLHETVLSDYREPDLTSADERIVRAAGGSATGAALLALVCAHTPDAAKLEQVRSAIRQLGDDRFATRERASQDLARLGPVAAPFLREAAKDEDREVARRARECLKQIGEQGDKRQLKAAIRLLGWRRPAGAAEALLNYLPAAGDDAAEVRAVLFALARMDGKRDPVLVKVLEDKDPVRRAAAAAALGEDGGAYARQPGRRVYARVAKVAIKEKSWADGVLQLEVATSDYEFFNAFDDKVFARP